MGKDQQSLKLLVINSSVILEQLRWHGFRRLDLRTQVVKSSDEVIEALEQSVPDAVFLEYCPTGLEAFDLCKEIRTRMGLADLPLVVVSKTSISRSLMTKIVESRCNDVLTIPLAPGQLHYVLCKYLSLPERREERVAVEAEITIEGDPQIKGRICDVTSQGARIQLPVSFKPKPGDDVRCYISSDPQMQVDSRLVWKRPLPAGTELAVEFEVAPKEVVTHLENMSTWRLKEQEGQQTVVLQGSLTERSSFSELPPRLSPQVVFDLRRLSMINSVGVGRWINMLRQIPAEVEYSFAHCSVTFCLQANYIVDMTGRGAVLSFFAPYECRSCAHEVERVLEAKALAVSEEMELPVFDCPKCGDKMAFADMPERYFQFLQPVH